MLQKVLLSAAIAAGGAVAMSPSQAEARWGRPSYYAAPLGVSVGYTPYYTTHYRPYQRTISWAYYGGPHRSYYRPHGAYYRYPHGSYYRPYRSYYRPYRSYYQPYRSYYRPYHYRGYYGW